MNLVQIHDINDVDSPVFLTDPEDNIVGEIKREVQFLDVRIQIKERQLEGYKIKFKDRYIRIKSNGKLVDYPEGLFDKTQQYSYKLI